MIRQPSQNKQILITVKADPNPSREYGETICCAGIDLSNNQFIRLYPIPFRYLEDERKFRKYSIIGVDCFRPNDDSRPESFSINCDTIRVLEYLGPENATWQKRKNIVLSAPVKSMCQALKDVQDGDFSLGMIKPREISFAYTKRWLAPAASRKAYYAQLSLLKKDIQAIEAVPFQFYYAFKCYGIDDCPGHELPIVDWEINQAYRNWRLKYSAQEELLGRIKQRWLAISNTAKNDVHFYIGNRKLNKKTFMVLGVFWPALEN